MPPVDPSLETTAAPTTPDAPATRDAVADRSSPPQTGAEKLIEHLDRAQRLSKTGSWEWDIASNDVVWSPQIFRIFGLDPEKFRPSYPAFLQRLHPDDRERVELAVSRAVEGLELYSIDHRIVLPDGAVRFVHEEGEVVHDGEGRPVTMLGAIQDVTELHAAEAATRQSQEMLASLFRISPEALVVTDMDARIMLFSAGAEMMFGYSADEVIGLGVENLMPVRFRRRHQDHVEAFAEGTEPSLRMHERGEILGLRRNGEEFSAEASLAKLETAEGYVYTTIIRDLSATKAAEQRLIYAREEAERASLAKSSFLANMSHEIRTPLNGVLGVASALARTNLDSRQAEMVQLIETSGRALRDLLSDILDLAKLDAGRMTVKAERFSLDAMVQDTFALFQASAAEKGVGLRLNVEKKASGDYCGDDLKIRQVLSNLLSNAVKFTEQGEIRLTIATMPGGGGDRLIFTVEDTGIGFDPAIADQLFGRFEQADSSITRRFGGTGLGLSISRSLVSLMNGEIRASSTLGQGSSFSFELPLRRAAAAASAPQAIPSPELPTDNRRMRVLLAEDHPVNRRTVELILEPLPVDLTCVENGQLAVEAAEADDFDLILMDMQMPVMDGLTAVERIRARQRATGARASPICMLTANALPDHRASSEAAGADLFLAKPIDAASLIALVLEACTTPGMVDPGKTIAIGRSM